MFAACLLPSGWAAADGRATAPRRIHPPADAKPLTSSRRPAWAQHAPPKAAASKDHAPVAATAGALKWRARRPASFKLAAPGKAEQSGTASNAENAGPVKPVGHWQRADSAPSQAQGPHLAAAAALPPLDPFKDPFGDRIAQGDAATQSPALASPGAPSDLSLPSDLDGGSPAPSEPKFTDPSPIVPGAPRLDTATPDAATPDQDGAGASPRRPSFLTPSTTPDLGPAEPLQHEQDRDCNRSYKDRDVCDEETECAEVWRQLKHHPLREMPASALDITARFTPQEKDPEKVDRQRKAKLEVVKEREWKNREGKVVATGRLENFVHGKVVVATSGGATTEIPFHDLGRDELSYVTAFWGLPAECALPKEEFPMRDWTMLTFTWKASALYHKPLYFEERALERYGHSLGPILQPAASGAHFFAGIAALPYSMGMNPPWESKYALGNYRPGDCAPYLVPPAPLSLRGALTAGGVYTALPFLIP